MPADCKKTEVTTRVWRVALSAPMNAADAIRALNQVPFETLLERIERGPDNFVLVFKEEAVDAR